MLNWFLNRHIFHCLFFIERSNEIWTVFWLLGEIKLPAEYCQEELDLNADLQVLLPRRQGLGLCSTALVSYLIALHNDLIYAVDKHTGEETR